MIGFLQPENPEITEARNLLFARLGIGGTGMGFFSGLLRGAVGIARSIFAPATVATAARVLPAAARVAPIVTRGGRIARGLAGAVAAGGAFAAGDIALSSLLDGGDGGTLAIAGGGAVGAGCPGGATGNIVTTLVITRNAAGEIICSRRLRGSPHLMNSDLIVAKRVRRVAGELAQKLVPRIRKQSKTSKLTEAIQDSVMRRVAQDAACPPSSAHA